MKRRDFLKIGVGSAGLGLLGPIGLSRAYAASQGIGLANPALQSMFTNVVPNALDPAFKFKLNGAGKLRVAISQTTQMTGLLNNAGIPVATPVWGYGVNGGAATWPGRTIEAQSYAPVEVKWENKLTDAAGLPLPHLLPVDDSLHWCYALPGYQGVVNIANDGVPLVAHLHGGHNDSPVDGNPEYFFGVTDQSRGPRWVDKKYVYDNSQPAGTLWYHDHALGITRLNVYAGLAGFYILRDSQDTGMHDNPLGLPAGDYEMGYAIQDRMFKDTGELFFPAYVGDPAWDDFIVGEGATLPPDRANGPSALAEFFGDIMVVNGTVWPKANVEPRHYRLRLLNGCDSRFMRLRLRIVPANTTDLPAYDPNTVLQFYVIGSDQGLLANAVLTDTVDFLPGERQDIVINFGDVKIPPGSRIIMENMLGDAPYGGDLPAPEDLFTDRRTDRVMAFDITKNLDTTVADNFNPAVVGGYTSNTNPVTRTRKLALFEGTDDFGRLMPMLGTAEPTVDVTGNLVNGSMPWHLPITENPGLGDTEIWEIYNATEDAHPIHVHLVNFEILDRAPYSATLVPQPVLLHNGEYGNGFYLDGVTRTGPWEERDAKEAGPKDMVTSLPGTITRIKMTFDKPGRYVWHCHILSHEDHEMMRPFHVGPGPY